MDVDRQRLSTAILAVREALARVSMADFIDAYGLDLAERISTAEFAPDGLVDPASLTLEMRNALLIVSARLERAPIIAGSRRVSDISDYMKEWFSLIAHLVGTVGDTNILERCSYAEGFDYSQAQLTSGRVRIRACAQAVDQLVEFAEGHGLEIAQQASYLGGVKLLIERGLARRSIQWPTEAMCLIADTRLVDDDEALEIDDDDRGNLQRGVNERAYAQYKAGIYCCRCYIRVRRDRFRKVTRHALSARNTCSFVKTSAR